MSRTRISTTVDAERIAECRAALGVSDSELLDRALAALLRELVGAHERRALEAAPYEDDPELAWQAPPGPDLPYDGPVPEEAVRLAAQRRGRGDAQVAGLGHGQVWWADIDKVRPVLVLTRAAVADRLHRVLVAPITTTVRDIPVEVPLGPGEGVVEGSVANLDNVQLVPVGWLLEPGGTLAPGRWDEVCAAMTHAIACD